MKRLIAKSLGTAALALAVVFGAPSARAGASFDFLFQMDRVSDDRQLFLNLAVSNYGYDQAVLEPVLPRIQYVEVDLPVVLFLAHESGRPPDYIVDLRAGGLSWSAVFTRCGVSPEVLFQGIDADPGPPYGNAYGYWKKNPRAARLSDADIAGLVQVQIGSRVAGVRTFDLARARGNGRSVFAVVAEKKGRPYHDHAGKPSESRGPHGKKGKGRGRD